MPEALHHPRAYGRNPALGMEGEPPLNLWMELREIRSENLLIDGDHAAFLGLIRRQLRADGTVLDASQPVIASANTPKFNVTGLNAASK